MTQGTTTKRKQPRRQAVVMIHGIGEQIPMSTLRTFVANILADQQTDQSPLYYSLPDPFSKNFELRCLATPGQRRPRTDFYEFYWQHLMPQAEWSRIFDWAWFMINRPIRTVPTKLVSIWWLLWIGVGGFGLFTLIGIGQALLHPGQDNGRLLHIPFGIALIWLFLQGVLLSTVGDAALYLRAHPRNIAARHEIRSSGVSLLLSLHKSGKYDRIVIVGHSLGSVIGYDILNLAWHRYCEQHGVTDKPVHDCLHSSEAIGKEINSFTAQAKPVPRHLAENWRSATKNYGRELRSNGHAWLITDFVTLGSPLAHADLLLARSREDLNLKIQQRELTTSPPMTDNNGRFSRPVYYQLPDQSQRTTYIPHHAAWTACVRWKNLYFPNRWLIKGDLIGGPLGSLFGAGIEDIPVRTRIRNGLLAHTAYWEQARKGGLYPHDALTQLRLALDLQGKGYRPEEREDV